MNIALVSMVYPHPRPGFWPGIERQVGDLAGALRDAGAVVDVITSFRNGGPAFETRDGIHIHRVTDSAHRIGRLGYVMNRHVKTFGAHALHLDQVLGRADVVQSFVPLPRHPALERRGLSSFAFFAHRDRPSRWSDYLHQPEHFRMEKSYFARVAGVIVASEESRRVLVEEYGVAASKITIIPLGVSARFLCAGDRPVRKVEEGPLRLLYVGPLIRRKGLAALVEALPRVRAEGLDVRAVLVGDGPEKAALVALAQRLGVADRLELAGFVEEARLPAYYRDADLFVFPSLKEGFGLVLVEAMASGVPVIASSAPPIPEVTGDAALHFAPGDSESLSRALVRAARDAGLRETLAAAGRRRVQERYLWSRVAGRTMELFRRARAA